MLEKGTYISNEVLNEGIIDDIGYKLGLKKKSRWQRFKDTIKNNKGKVAAIGALGLGLGAAGALRYRRNNQGNNSGTIQNTPNTQNMTITLSEPTPEEIQRILERRRANPSPGGKWRRIQ